MAARTRGVFLGGVGMVAVAVGLWGLTRHVANGATLTTLAEHPKPVSVVSAKASSWRGTREYVGSIEPWVEARIGPQIMNAYVSTVLVRPGDVVKRGDVLATLDCRSAAAGSQAVEMQARAIQARQKATASEASRLNLMLDGGFASQNEVEQKLAQDAEQQAQLLATKARLEATTLETQDCVLRAPFDGEIARRDLDPGAFVRPGVAVLTLVDRGTVRLVADVPESDFGMVPPGTPVKVELLATAEHMDATIARRAPAADDSTRTIHIELDVADAKRRMPVGTTARLAIEVGVPVPAVEVPLAAASVRGSKATVVTVSGNVAHPKDAKLLGERAGVLFLDGLEPGVKVVTQGRGLVKDGDTVAAAEDAFIGQKPVTASTEGLK